MALKGKITVSSKKRNATQAGLPHEAKIDADVIDTTVAHEAGFVGKYDEIPQETAQDEEKKRLKKEYQKRKLKKQRQSKKGFDIVREETDLVRLSTETDAVDFSHHLGIQIAKDSDTLKQIKKKSRLGRALLNDNEDDDVLVGKSAATTNAGALETHELLQLRANQNKIQVSQSTTDKKDKRAKEPEQQLPLLVPQLTKRQLRKEQKKVTNKSTENSMLSTEHQRQLALLGMVADKQETWVDTRIKKEEAKIEHFNDKEQKKLEKKERDLKIKNLMLEQVRMKLSAEKQEKREAKAMRDEEKEELGTKSETGSTGAEKKNKNTNRR